ncbi:TfuA-like protein [Streptomyces sp. NBC_00237]|uniref:TfuA-like protein n=1 Tax=Streptomyces sp. NBC_00237 TaxID=2975687 RepID=UPI002256E974|nr:TfuA-like protein [Streptomyces sp. NBC_00237]MCX5206323.1 TfuA-like protein [Streptomyces sp. NBC_00237]
MTQLYLFLGPTLPGFEGPADIRVLPPVVAGDLLRLPLREGDVVGIVDGYFHQQLSVRHKEILAVMDRGVHVLGSSSMGALRAAELDVFGMHGVGQVYTDYRAGRTEGDDEVALRHGPPESGYRAMSVPLVNMRATFAAAHQSGVCDRESADRIVEALRSVPYAQRTYRLLPSLADEVDCSQQELAELEAFCVRHPVDVKRADALELIERMRQPEREPARRPGMNRTVHLVDWELAARGRALTDQDALPYPAPGDLDALRVLQLFSAAYPAFLHEERLSWIAEECTEQCGTSTAPTGHAAAAIAHSGHRGVFDVDGDLGFLDDWLTASERAGGDPQEKARLFLARSFQIRPGVAWEEPLLDRLQHTPGFAHASAIAQASHEVETERVRRDPAYSHALLPLEPIRELLTALWGSTEQDADIQALDRGFGSLKEAAEAARPFYLIVHCGADLGELSDFSAISILTRGKSA